MKQVIIKNKRVSTALIKQLEAAGFAVILIFSATAHGEDVKRGDVTMAMIQARLEKEQLEQALKLELNKSQLEATMVAEQE